jgi:hypothetical protein
MVYSDLWCTSEALMPAVTEPLKLIPYYCPNHSSWPLSNNIEVTCRLCRVKPSKSLTSQDRHLYNKLTQGDSRGKQVTSYYITSFTGSLLQTKSFA